MAKKPTSSAAANEPPIAETTVVVDGYQIEISVDGGYLWVSHDDTKKKRQKTFRIPLGPLSIKEVDDGKGKKQGGYWTLETQSAAHGWPVHTVQQ